MAAGVAGLGEGGASSFTSLPPSTLEGRRGQVKVKLRGCPNWVSSCSRWECLS